MNKQLAAMIAAILMTACIGFAILAIGGMALFNPNGTAAANSPSQVSSVNSDQQAQDQAQIQQLQSQIVQYQQQQLQYQQRETLLQQQLDQANAQIKSAQSQIQQIQALLTTLQQRGIITIASDGQVFINK
jgi:peptidoglycan hydrolase CwlO-like protein